MKALIDNGKYKVTEVLYSDGGYEVCLCSDVMVNTGRTVIVNTYKSKEYISEMLPIFFEINKNGMSDFVELITAGGSVSAVFLYHKGVPFEEYYPLKNGKKRPARDFVECIRIAEKLLLRALELDLADDRIAFCVLSEHSITVDITAMTVGFNYQIRPKTAATPLSRGQRLGELLERIFPKNRYLPVEIERFMLELREDKYPACTAAYSRWREVAEQAQKTREEYEKESLFKYLSRKAKLKKQDK